MAAQPGDPEALLLYQLIGAPLLAVVQAEAQAAQVSAEFIKRIGFESPQKSTSQTPASSGKDSTDKPLQEGGDFGSLKTAEFTINRGDANGHGAQVVSVPVLSLLPIPLMQVKDAEFDFDVRILTRVPLQSSEGSLPVRAEPGTATGKKAKSGLQTGHELSNDFLAPERVELKGMLAPRSHESGSMQMGMKVKVRMEQADMPAGLSKLLHVMEHSIAVKPKRPAIADSSQADPGQAQHT